MNAETETHRVIKGIAGFVDEMREQGIHVGMGSDPHCVVDGERWPCSHEQTARRSA